MSTKSPPDDDFRGCGCLGCTEQARVIIRHPIHGHRTVCFKHRYGHPIVDYV